MNKKVRLIAYYLPQYHPIPENDIWWGKGFTEWISVAQAKPLFKGHYQPRIPGELGFYDLRIEKTRIQQAELASEYGIEGFCYWHYWLGDGKKLLEMPFEKVLESKKPDFPFCLGWANHSWKGVYFGANNRTLIDQTYPSMMDHKNHFYYLLKGFSDYRYITVNECPLLQIHDPYNIPDCKQVLEFWRELANMEGLKGLHLVGYNVDLREKDKFGLDAVTYSYHREIEHRSIKNKYIRFIKNKFMDVSPFLKVYSYEDALKYFVKEGKVPENEYPSIITGWDTTPRLNTNAVILDNYTPELFRIHVRNILGSISAKNYENNIVFIKSWNEWAEGNYLEPDRKYGRQFLEVLKEELMN